MIVAGRLPDKARHPFLRRQCERLLNGTPGLIDWAETKDDGTLLFFGTRTHAEKAQAAMIKSHNPCSRQIFLADADYQKHQFTVHGPLQDLEDA